MDDTKTLQARDHAHYLHPFTDHKLLGERGVRVMVRGEGIYLWDSEGKKILDGMSGLWCVNLGYGRHSISQAVFEQMETLPFYNSFFNTTNIPAVALAAKLAEIAPPGFRRVFFTGSGSEANDTNVRMVRRSPNATPSSAASMPTTAAPWPALPWAAWKACTRKAACRSLASCTSASRTISNRGAA